MTGGDAHGGGDAAGGAWAAGGRSPREEAERLVATVLGTVSLAVNALDGYATGSAECCVCPICRAIAAARDPSPEFAERLATGVGDLAVGLAGVLRAFGTRDAGAPGAAGTAGDEPASDGPAGDGSTAGGSTAGGEG